MRFPVLIPALSALALVACQQSSPEPSDARKEPLPQARTDPAPPAGASPMASVTPSASPSTAKAIPEQFRGVWDNAKGTCDPPSDLRMAIGPVSVEFYESLGTVTGVTVESPDSIRVDLAMEGEGERWEFTNRYVLSDGGATLTPTDASGKGGLVIPRKRCQS